MGAELVDQNANYGFIIESAQAEQLTSFCRLDTIGDLGQRHYALPFPKGSQLAEKVSKQILTYIESGALYRLKNKWSPSKNCSAAAENEAIVRAIPYSK